MELLGGMLVFGPFLLSIALLPVVAFGIVWSPAGALICGASAYFRGLNPIHHALAGLVYSALLFLPWIYLILRIFNVIVPRGLVTATYIVLYFSWFFGVFLLGLTIAISTGASAFRSEIPSDLPAHVIEQWPSPLLAYTTFIVAALSGITWLGSLIWLIRSDRRSRKEADASLRSSFSSPAYILPFAFVLVWMVVNRITSQDDALEAITSIFTSSISLF